MARRSRKSFMPTPLPSKSHGPGAPHSASRARKSLIPTLPSLSPLQSHGHDAVAVEIETILRPYIAAWAPNALFGLLGIYLLLYVKT